MLIYKHMNKIIAIMGTTASKKSDIGIYLAKHLNGEIVSCDSRQIYVGLDLGSGKVTKDEQNIVKHHMLDIINPGDIYSVAEFQKKAYEAIDDILSRNKLPILVGGTGLYVRAVTDGYNFNNVEPNYNLRKELESKSKEDLLKIIKDMGLDEQELKKLSPSHLIRRIEIAKIGVKNQNPNIPKYEVLKIVLTYPKDILKQRIKDRIDIRLKQGMIKEVEDLIKKGVPTEFLDKLGLEYRYISRYCTGKITYEQFYNSLYKDTCAFAKRQITWFKKDNAIWLNPEDSETILKKVKEFLNK